MSVDELDELMRGREGKERIWNEWYMFRLAIDAKVLSYSPSLKIANDFSVHTSIIINVVEHKLQYFDNKACVFFLKFGRHCREEKNTVQLKIGRAENEKKDECQI